MPQYKEIGNGTIGPNKWKKKNSPQPDFLGSITLDDVKTNIAAWRRFNVDADGKKNTFFSFALTQIMTEEESEADSIAAFDDNSDDNPF